MIGSSLVDRLGGILDWSIELDSGDILLGVRLRGAQT